MAAATDQYTDPADLSGFLKPVFGELQWLLPEEVIVQKEFPFNEANAVGKSFEEPYQVQSSWGLTFGGNAADVVALTEAKPSKTVPAVVKPFLTILNDKVSYGQFDRGAEAGKKAFMSTGAYIGKNLTMQLRRVLELCMLCGQDGFMTIESYSTGTVATGRAVVSAATLRSGVLAFLEGAKVDILAADKTTMIANGAAGDSAGIEVLAVDIENRTIDFKALPTLDGSGTPVVPVAGQIFYLHGANLGSSNFMEMVGLQKQISAITGTIFEINKATYMAARGNTMPSAGPMSAGLLGRTAAKAINRGFQGEAIVLLSPLSWGELNARNIAQQVFDQSYKPGQAEVGTDAIIVRANGVKMRVLSHSMVADGEFFFLPKASIKRIGSKYENSGEDGKGDTDISFMIPGTNQKFVQPIPGYNAVKVEVRSDQAIYLQKPPHAVYGSGLTHT